jgi:geranylgeranyl reductase family protein
MLNTNARRRLKIAIVGAGPAGSTAALQLGSRHDVTLIDREVFPRMKTCGSALSPRVIGLSKSIGLFEPMAANALWMRGLRFTGPKGQRAVLAGNEGNGWVIPRSVFDGVIAHGSERRGAKFEQGFKVTRLLKDPRGRVHGVTDGKRQIEADLTLIADGGISRFSPDRRPRKQIATIMGWFHGVSGVALDHVEMFWDKRISPWYGWLFPETKERVNIGICYDPEDPAPPKELFQEIVERQVGARMKGAEQVIKFRGAPIVYTERIGEVATPGALWIGEAARLTNAATGEGIFYAMQSAMVAADVIDKVSDGELGRAYRDALTKTFTTRFRIAIGFLKFLGSPAFSAASSFVAFPPIQMALAWGLAQI